ncbi:MAG: hypothetical protein Q4C56_06245 [Peptococcaceae bacterium]|nr:hypothetical protein [Peptococcaceae bacterium]
MNDQEKPSPEACDDTSCKEDLFAGLMNLFAQAEAEDSDTDPSDSES